jgi:hypothetical protein
MPELHPFDPERQMRTLAAHQVRFVLVGALGAGFYGFPRMTADADITPAGDAENLQRLAAALRELNARVFTDTIPEGLPFDCSATPNAVHRTVYGSDLLIARLEDILRSKVAADRPQDRQDAIVIRQMLAKRP